MRLFDRLRYLSSALAHLVSQPRKTEATVSALSAAHLRSLIRPHGTVGMLPYTNHDVAALIWEVKYYGNPRAIALGSAILSERVLAVCEESLGIPLLVPIPTRKNHTRRRGHNHTTLLCAGVSKLLGESVEYRESSLSHTRTTLPQQGLPRDKRLTNVENSMRADSCVMGRVCIVIDDVVTTGATFHEATRALSDAGASGVLCLALAQA